ncbi:CBS domain-containing protein [Tepidibacter thalassicus]|uniref:CBS domain-containing protein n=1 Tax=Tepidibacter thalassicus DSM 15285 TaxID=1123350 RepID=A0A1M5NQ60_9FIRM|nr:CBS domain-containing protein [Tepidibacter thalassicus]SHG91696.1 CBS domain-containing protein [Tepidibacter thalassicus DSM 15285]
MNIAFFLTPKKDVAYISPDSTMRQALEKMEYHRYTAIPIIDDNGKYIGTITEGDLLWKLKNTPELSFKNTSKILLKDVPRHMNNKPVSINANIEDLISIAVRQNFVPVVDDQQIFIGIIKRSEIIDYCYKFLFNK